MKAYIENVTLRMKDFIENVTLRMKDYIENVNREHCIYAQRCRSDSLGETCIHILNRA